MANPPNGSQAGLWIALSRIIASGMVNAQSENQRARERARVEESRSKRAAAIPGAPPNKPAARATISLSSYPRWSASGRKQAASDRVASSAR